MSDDLAAKFFCLRHKFNNLSVIDHQSALIRHKNFKRSNAMSFANFFYLGTRLRIEIGDSHMKRVIRGSLSLRHFVPLIYGLLKRLALTLNREINDGRRTAV